MIDVTTFDSLVSPSSLFFEEQTIDRLGRIRVNNRSNLNSINQIKSTFFDELNKTNPNARNIVSTVQSLVSNNRPHISQSTIINRPNYSKQIQPKLPFSHNNYNIQQGPAQQSPMFRSVQPLPTYTPTREIPQGNNIFTRIILKPDIPGIFFEKITAAPEEQQTEADTSAAFRTSKGVSIKVDDNQLKFSKYDYGEDINLIFNNTNKFDFIDFNIRHFKNEIPFAVFDIDTDYNDIFLNKSLNDLIDKHYV